MPYEFAHKLREVVKANLFYKRCRIIHNHTSYIFTNENLFYDIIDFTLWAI